MGWIASAALENILTGSKTTQLNKSVNQDYQLA